MRFVLEAKAASALDHPNICTIYEIAETRDGKLFLAMAYYDGVTLKAMIERAPLALERAVDITRRLAEAHRRTIVHREIKPANVMVTSCQQVEILDFGLAKLLAGDRLTQRN